MSTVSSIISVDDHVLEPPNLWTDRLPKKYLAEGPRLERLPRGTTKLDAIGRKYDTPGVDGPLVDYWHFEDTYWGLSRTFAAAGWDERERWDDSPLTYDDIRPGCFKVVDRLADMDINNVQASLCFPNYVRFAGQRFAEAHDLDLGLACIQAYNDWMVEEWAGQSGGRLIPLCLVPLWDAELAAAEVRRNAARGVTAVCFTELPQNLGLPSIHRGYWDPFFAACDETDTVICIHIGSGTRPFRTSEEAPPHVHSALSFVMSCGSMSEYLCTGILGRFPTMKLFYAESQVGWIPFALDRLEDSWEVRYRFADDAIERPSFYYRDRIYSCMFKDKVGARLMDLIGEDQVMFETDYPHSDGTWPNSIDRANELVRNLSPELQHKVLRGTAIKLFRLPFAP